MQRGKARAVKLEEPFVIGNNEYLLVSHVELTPHYKRLYDATIGSWVIDDSSDTIIAYGIPSERFKSRSITGALQRAEHLIAEAHSGILRSAEARLALQRAHEVLQLGFEVDSPLLLFLDERSYSVPEFLFSVKYGKVASLEARLYPRGAEPEPGGLGSHVTVRLLCRNLPERFDCEESSNDVRGAISSVLRSYGWEWRSQVVPIYGFFTLSTVKIVFKLHVEDETLTYSKTMSFFLEAAEKVKKVVDAHLSETGLASHRRAVEA